MERVTYITSFRKLILTEPISGYIELIHGVNITNDPHVKAQWLTSQCRAAIGAIEAAHLEGESNLVFGEFDAADMHGLPPEGFLLVILAWLDMLLKNAWLIKDHAMECDAAFLRVEMTEGVSWTKNFLAIRPSFSDGYTDKNIEMSVDELKKWGQTNDLVEGYLRRIFVHAVHDGKRIRPVGQSDAIRGRRPTRARFAFKIANYCSALETLFTTESTELAHKLAERVAFFLGERGHNRRAVFATIKSAYNVRSKLVHGDTLKQNQIEGLPALSAECDVNLRTILLEIFNSEELKKIFDAHSDAIEDYFARLILGPSTSL